MIDGPQIAVVIASAGRPTELGRWVTHIARQTLKPVELIFSVTSSSDMPLSLPASSNPPVRVVISKRGSSAQRNAGLDAIRSDPDIVAFFDDDYVPSGDCLEGVAASFAAMPEVVGLSGKLLADGVNSPGIDYATACKLISEDERARIPSSLLSFRPTKGLYGCNMAFRWRDVADHRFDARLPLYGWQEDYDFAARVGARRPVGYTNGFVGVHQGIKGGRTSGRRFGYSQVANPFYLCRKGSMDVGAASTLIIRNLLANHLRVVTPEPWVDRRGRAIGNWIAIYDALRRRLHPERAAEL